MVLNFINSFAIMLDGSGLHAKISGCKLWSPTLHLIRHPYSKRGIVKLRSSKITFGKADGNDLNQLFVDNDTLPVQSRKVFDYQKLTGFYLPTLGAPAQH